MMRSFFVELVLSVEEEASLGEASTELTAALLALRPPWTGQVMEIAQRQDAIPVGISPSPIDEFLTEMRPLVRQTLERIGTPLVERLSVGEMVAEIRRRTDAVHEATGMARGSETADGRDDTPLEGLD